MLFFDKAIEILGDVGGNATNLRLLSSCLDQLVPFVGAGLSVPLGYPQWGQFLDHVADRLDLRPEVEHLLSAQQFEEAAEALAVRRPKAFDDILEETFGDATLKRPLRQCAVSHLCRVARGPVLTTNFDRVLEHAFEDGGHRFEEVFCGSRIRQASRAIQLNQPYLLKLHGDYRDSANRVLTLAEYAREYGHSSPDHVDFDYALPRILSQVLGARPLLFLGCSLKGDRTTLVVAEIAKRLEGTVHFALLSASENTPDRLRQLDSWNIRPLFFPPGDFAKIDDFLVALADSASSIPRLTNRRRLDPMPLPPDFVPRQAEFEEAKTRILSALDSSRGARSIALVGAGGFGKTTLAQALCTDQAIRAAFPDGILWVGTDQNPNIRQDLGDLYESLTGAASTTDDERELGATVAAELERRSVLVVIDNVWNGTYLNHLLDATPCVRLITTRVVEVLDETVDLVRVDEMRSYQSIELLLRGVDTPAKDERGDLQSLADALGNWPLLLKLANSKLRIALRRRGASIATALALVVKEYRNRGLDSLNRNDPRHRNDAAGMSIRLSVDQLSSEDRSHFMDLGVFPKAVDIPSLVAADLWQVGPEVAESILLGLDDWSLLKYRVDDQTFRLHEILYDWMHGQMPFQNTHARLVGSAKWNDVYRLPYAYAWRWFCWHLIEAGRIEQAMAMLVDPEWMGAKLEHTSLGQLVADYDLVSASKPHVLLKRILSQAWSILTENPEELPAELFSRLMTTEEPTLKLLRDELGARLSGIVPRWPSVMQADHECRHTFEGISGWLNSLVISNERLLFYATDFGKAIKIWHLTEDREVQTLRSQYVGVNSIALSGDGRTLVAGVGVPWCPSHDTVEIWDLGIGGQARSFKGEFPWVTSVIAVDEDGSRLLYVSHYKTIKVLNLKSGQEEGILAVQDESFGRIAVANDWRTLVTTTNGELTVWDVETSGKLATLPSGRRWVGALTLSPDGDTLFCGCDENIQIWDIKNGTIVKTLKCNGEVRSLALSSDLRTVYAGLSDHTISAWEIGTGRQTHVFAGHLDSVTSIALAGGSPMMASLDHKTVRVWDLGDELSERGQTEPEKHVYNLLFSLDGKVLVAGCDGTSLRLDLETGATLRTFSGGSPTGISDDGLVLLSESKLWNLSDGTEIGTLPEAEWSALSKDGRVAAVYSDEVFSIWNVERFEEVHRIWLEPKHWVPATRCMAMSGDGKLLACSVDESVKIWNLTSGLKVMTLKHCGSNPQRIALSDDGKWLVSGYHDQHAFWNLSSGEMHTIAEGECNCYRPKLWNGRTRRFITEWRDDLTVWDLEFGSVIHTIHGAGVRLALSPDGLTMVSGLNRTVKAWNVEDGTCLGSFSLDYEARYAAVAQNLIAVSDYSGAAHLFEIRRP